MALRAGYYGLKGAIKSALEKLANDTSGMKIIKSFGDGLNLTNAGKLSLTAATGLKLGGIKVGDGLSINDGVLSVTGGGAEYKTGDPYKIGEKWLDGKDIYRVVIPFMSSGVIISDNFTATGTANVYNCLPLANTAIDNVVSPKMWRKQSGGFTAMLSGNGQAEFNASDKTVYAPTTLYNDAYLIVDFTMIEE